MRKSHVPTLYLHVFLIVPQVQVVVQYFSFVQQGHRSRIFPVFVRHRHIIVTQSFKVREHFFTIITNNSGFRMTVESNHAIALVLVGSLVGLKKC